MRGCAFISAYFGLQELGIKRDGAGGWSRIWPLARVCWLCARGERVREGTHGGMLPAAPRVSVGTTTTPESPFPPPPSVSKQKKKGEKPPNKQKTQHVTPSFVA